MNLENCERCGGVVRPHWYYNKSDGKTYLNGASCQDCLKELVLPQITREEFYGRGSRGW